jgi:hypothetical protein
VGDANGPIGANQVNALSTVLDPNVPINSLIDDPIEFRVLVRDPAGGGIRTALQSELLTEFDHILRSRADLIVAVGPPVAGVFTLTPGSYFVKTAFALAANEGMAINGGNVFIQGGGSGKTITGGSAVVPLLNVLAGTCQLLTIGLVGAVANTTVWRCGGDVSTATQCVFLNAASTTNPTVESVGASRMSLVSCRIECPGLGFRHGAAGQRATFVTCRIITDLGTCVSHLSANGWLQISDSVVRHTGAAATGPVFLQNAATSTLQVLDTEVASGNAAQPCLLVSSAGSVNVTGGEWQTSSAVASNGITVAGAVTRGLTVDDVDVLNCAVWVNYSSGLVAAARISRCIGHTGVTTCSNWQVANIPTRGLVELANSWNAATASVFTNHQQNDARVNRRSNHSSTAPMSETGIVP